MAAFYVFNPRILDHKRDLRHDCVHSSAFGIQKTEAHGCDGTFMAQEFGEERYSSLGINLAFIPQEGINDILALFFPYN